MEKSKNLIQKEIDKIWPTAQKDATKLFRASEKKIAQVYSGTKKKAQELMFLAKREELYYELGKSIAGLLTAEQLKNKNVLKINTEIRLLNKKIRSKK